MMRFSTGNDRVDYIGTMHFSGNMIPHAWFKTICYGNGKPNLNAIVILSDIVYWYRPQAICDESSGQVTGYRKKFSRDILQRSYQQISEMFGLTKRQATAAVDFLQALGVIRKEFRTINSGGQNYNNVLFLDIIPERLKELTYPQKTVDNGTLSHTDETPVTFERDRVSHLNVIPVTSERETNTEITTKITSTDYDNQIYLHPARADPMDEIEAYKQLIRKNIDYGIYMERFQYKDREQFEELYQLICDVVCMTPERIRIGGQEYPGQVVKSRFLKLRATHLEYVIESLNKTTTKINNIRAYLLTALYRSTETVMNRISQQVQHDLYGASDEEAHVA